MGDGVRVLGVDACRAGWTGITLHGGAFASAHVAPTMSALLEVVEADGRVQIVAIDIPIGLPDRGRRRADVLAGRLIGGLRSAVFTTPVRAALELGDFPAAVVANRELAGAGISKQAYGLRTKVFDVERFVRAGDRMIIEVHPEVCFAQMNGGPLCARKVTWAGVESRRALLARAGVVLPAELGPAGLGANVDDVLDAAAAAWTATRHVAGCAISYPDPPEVFSDGWHSAIWV